MSVILTSVSGEPGWYALVDPAQSVTGTLPHLETEPAATMPDHLYIQRGGTKKATLPRALDTLRDGAIVVRADIGKKIVAGTSLKTRPIAVAMADGKRVSGWVMLVVDDWVVGDDPLSGPIARRVDAPSTLVATDAFAKLLARASGNTIRAAEPGSAPLFIQWAKLRYPDARAARAAYLAYTPKQRRAALAHPLYALAVALQVDRAPKPDTRAAACRHPLSAVAYAILVDRKSRPATREAADRKVFTAHRYAYALDRAISDGLSRRMQKSGAWNAELVAIERAHLAELHGIVAATPLATRALPKRPKRPLKRIDDAVTDAKVRSDIEEMTARGIARIDAVGDPVPETIDKLHRYVDAIRDGTVGKLGKKLGVVQLELACAFADQLHRAFAWQWTLCPEAVGIASPDRANAVALLALFGRIARPKSAASNTVALLFNMIAAGDLFGTRRGQLASIA